MLLFLLQQNKSGRPIFIALQLRHGALEKQSRDSFEFGRTRFFLSRGEIEQPEAIRVSRKEETNNAMSGGSVLFPEEGELPRGRMQIHKIGFVPSCFTTRSLIIIIFCTRDRCDWKTPCRSSFRRQRQRRYLFYSPLCVVACKGLENRYLCKKGSAVITNAATAVQSTANANVPPQARRRPTEHALSVVTTIFMAFGT